MTSLQPPGAGSLAPLPLICPRCLAAGANERALVDGACPGCGARPLVEGSLFDFIADETGDRPRFYQEEDAYLREHIAEENPAPSLALTRSPGGLVLEIGSGRGAYGGLGGPDYVALDYSGAHLRRFLEPFRRIRASAELVPLRSASCRFIFTIATLEHVPDPSKAFSEIDRLLAPGGVAYVSPAWHCRPWAAEGLPVRPYRDLSLGQKLRKASIPLRDSLVWRGAIQIPWRVYRRLRSRGRRVPLTWSPLEANYEIFWMSDSDACAAIDSHEAVLFFERRGYEILRPSGGVLRRLFFRAGAVIVRKGSPDP